MLNGQLYFMAYTCPGKDFPPSLDEAGTLR
jgi:hypothetical protein